MAKKPKIPIKTPEKTVEWKDTGSSLIHAGLIALLLVAVTISIFPRSQSPTIDIKWLILNIGFVLLTMVWLIYRLLKGSWDWVNYPIHFPLLVLVILNFIAQIRPANRLYLLDNWIQFFTLIWAYLIISQTIRKENQIKIIIHGLLMGGLIAGLYGIFQKLGFDPISWEKRGDTSNIPSMLGNSNLFGWCLATLFPLSLGFLSLKCKSSKERIIQIIYPIILGIALSVARNRAGVVAVIGSILILGWIILLNYSQLSNSLFSSEMQNRMQGITKYRLGIQWVIIILIIGGLYGFWQRYSSRSDIAIKGRFLHWQVSAKMIQDYPVLGIGSGNYIVQYLDYEEKILADPKNSGYKQTSQEVQSINAAFAHNEYIQQLTDTGILGFATLLFFLITYLIIGYRDLLNIGNKDWAWLYLGSYGGVISSIITAFFGFPWHVPVSGMEFWALIGLTVCISKLNYKNGFEIWPKGIFENSLVRFCKSGLFIIILTILVTIYGIWVISKSLDSFRTSLYIREGRYWAEKKEPDFNQAMDSMERAVELSPDNGLAHYYLGGYYAQTKRYDDAISEYQKALRSYNDNHIYFNLGQIYYAQKEFNTAEKYYKKALMLDESKYQCHLQLGFIYTMDQNRYAQAIDEFNKYLEYEKTGPQADQIRQVIDILKKK